MTTSTLTVTDFVLARIAEDEAVARRASPGPWTARYADSPDCHMYGDFGFYVIGPAGQPEADDSEQGKADVDHIARHDPARVLAQCAAMRKIVERHEGYLREGKEKHPRDLALAGAVLGTLGTVRDLASIWSDHPDWREEWRA